MPDAPDFLFYARECTRLAETTGDEEDHAILLEMAKAWTELAVQNSVPNPNPPQKLPRQPV